jgi:phosphatidylinositol alpha-1,6-mannosyltransferase
MRHVLLSEQWFPAIGGSIHLFDEIYGRRFGPRERVRVIAARTPGDTAADANYRCPVTRFDSTRYAWMRPESLASYARMCLTVSRVIAQDHIDVVHCARVIPEGLVGLAAKRTLRVPYVVWVHGEEVSMFLQCWGKRALMPEVLREARAVICNSTFSLDLARLAGAPAERLHRVNPCVDPNRFCGPFDTQDIRERFALHGRTVVLTVGRLTRRKGHDHVLRALARLGRTDVVYLVLSDGEIGNELRALARSLRLDDIVRFVGPVSADELPRYYAACDVFVMANRTLASGDVEGFGLVFLEASASGRAVIGGRSGGVADAVEHGTTGLLVDAASVDEIAHALHSLIEDRSLRERLGEHGRTMVTRQFSWERAAQHVRQIVAEPTHRDARSIPPRARETVINMSAAAARARPQPRWQKSPG